MSDTLEFDYVVVGAGSAGCVVASRLSEDADRTVLLLEAGPEDTNPWIGIPAGMTRLFQPGPLNWGYFTEPEPHLDGRRVYWPRGRTLGGSSSINGMLYMRGHPADYDGWAQLGARGWSWEEVLPYYLKAEDHAHGASAMHGEGGPLAVTDLDVDDEAGRLFMAAAAANGTPERRDLNDGIQHGVGRPQVTIKRARRQSTATAYLHPVRGRANLAVETEALAHRVTIADGRATGVAFEQRGRMREAKARAEVILCGGVINSPQLLMLSGIGPALHLAEKRIAPIADLPGVGRNLQDHLYVYYVAEVTRRLSVNHQLRPGPRLLLNALRYLTTRKGYLNIGAVQATAFPIVGPGADRPDVEISFRPMSWDIVGGDVVLNHFPGIGAACSLLRPHARGRVELASADPSAAPLIHANYLDNEADLIVMREGMRWIRRVFASDPLAGHVREERIPGAGVETDAEWESYIRANAQSVYHPVGTCRMGDDDSAVVDPRLRVRGVAGLRVADASVMPRVTSSNTNAPTIMIGEKAADMIRQDARATGAARTET